MRVIIFADLHLHPWREFSVLELGVTSRLWHGLSVLRDIVNTAKEIKPDAIIFLGDFFHEPQRLFSPLVNLSVQIFSDLPTNTKFYAITGNHDLHSAYTTLSFYQGWKIILPSTYDPLFTIEDYVFYPVPHFLQANNVISHIRKCKNHATKTSMTKVLLGHFGTDVGTVNEGFKLENTVPVSELAPFDYAFLGHYHLPQQIAPNGYYIGSPLAHSFSDPPESRGYIILEDGVIYHRFLNLPRFRKFDFTKYPDEIGEFPLEQLIASKDYFHIRYPKALQSHPTINILGQHKNSVRMEMVKPPFTSRSSITISSSPQDIITEYVTHCQYDKKDKKQIISLGQKFIGQEWGKRKYGRTIQFQNLSIQNFNSIDQFQFSLPASGIHAITGNNGAGKSSLLEALLWCLYGRTSYDSSGIRVEDVINVVEEFCFVEASFLVDNIPYVVSRTRNRKAMGSRQVELSISIDGKEQKLQYVTDGQKLLDDILGLSYQAFKNSVFFGDRDTSRFEQLPDLEKKNFLEDLLDIGIISDALKKVRDEKKRMEGEKANSAGQAIQLDNQRQVMEQEIQKLQQVMNEVCSKEEIETQTKLLLEKKKRMEIQGEEIRNVGDTIHRQAEAYNEALQKRREYTMQRDTWIIDAMPDACPTCLQKISNEYKEVLKERQKKMNQKLDKEIHILDKKRKELQDEIAVYQELLNTHQEQHNLLTVEYGEIQVMLTRMEAQSEVHQEQMTEKTRRYAEIQSEIVGFTLIMAQIEDIIRQHDFWIEGFGHRRGLKAYIIENTLEDIQERFNSYFSILYPGFSAFFTIEEDGRLSLIFGNDDYQRSLATHSGGETKRVSIAMMLAFHSWVQEHKNNISLLILDEILDRLDEPGMEQVSRILQEISINEPVYICSHAYDLSDIATTETQCKKENGKSQVRILQTV